MLLWFLQLSISRRPILRGFSLQPPPDAPTNTGLAWLVHAMQASAGTETVVSTSVTVT